MHKAVSILSRRQSTWEELARFVDFYRPRIRNLNTPSLCPGAGKIEKQTADDPLIGHPYAARQSGLISDPEIPSPEIKQSMTISRRSPPPDILVSRKRLVDMLDDIHFGKLALPNFHREWCWPEGHMVRFLESIAEGHPIGFLTLIETGGNVSLGYRLFDVPCSPEASRERPQHLVMDGQQRLTSAYQACYADAPVKINSGSAPKHGFYFFDMRKAVVSTIPVTDALIFVETKPDGALRGRDAAAFSERAEQFRRGIFPVNEVLKFPAYEKAYAEFWDEIGGADRTEATQTLREFRNAIVDAFEQYAVPLQIVKNTIAPNRIHRLYEQLHS